jgi:hypothetical protein
MLQSLEWELEEMHGNDLIWFDLMAFEDSIIEMTRNSWPSLKLKSRIIGLPRFDFQFHCSHFPHPVAPSSWWRQGVGLEQTAWETSSIKLKGNVVCCDQKGYESTSCFWSSIKFFQHSIS